jgi:hypothetical protein
MSWMAHDLEPYVIQRYMGRRVAIAPLLIGSYLPDLATKWIVYGTGAFGVKVEASDPAQFHRGFPGVGFTHSPMFGVVVAALVYLIWRNKLWALSLLIGEWAHSFTDTLDTLGVMIAFPFSTHIYSLGMWKYAAEAGRFGDAAAYLSGPSVVWEACWVALALLSWRVLTRTYFREVIVPTDGFWVWLGRRLPEVAVLALYRSCFFFGVARGLAWLLWAHLINSYAFDFTWGGPHWQAGIDNDELNGGPTTFWQLVPALAITAACAVTYLRLSGHLRLRLPRRSATG